MKIFESGRESSLLQDMREGTKTIECRLAKGKFLQYSKGDRVYLREDIWKNNKLVLSKPRQLLVEIMRVEKYPDFMSMFEKVGFKKAIPRAESIEEAVKQTRMFYSIEDEYKYGVLAIYFKLIQV